jgi:hypothetical protein
VEKGIALRRVGIWIDHRKAIVVTIDEGGESRRVIENPVERHAGPEGSRRTSTPYGPQAPSFERQLEEKNRLHAAKFFKEVIKSMGRPDRLFVMGPADAKREFVERVEKESGLRGLAIKVETTDRMTEAQVAAKVRETDF